MDLSTQYYCQKRFRPGTPAYIPAELTPEEVLTAWEDHPLDISDPGNIEMVKNAVMSTFGIYIKKDEVELLKRFACLSKISVFETNTWKWMLCFRCCPKKDTSISLDSPVASNENLWKRKNDDSQEDDRPGPKRLARSFPEVTTSRDQTSIATATCPIAAASECTEVVYPTAASLWISSTESLLASIPYANEAQKHHSVMHKISVSEALSTSLTISSWLRLLLTLDLYSLKVHSRKL